MNKKRITNNQHFGYPSTSRSLSVAEGQGKRSVQATKNQQQLAENKKSNILPPF